MPFIDEASVVRMRPLLFSVIAAIVAFVVCTVGWRLLDTLLAPGMVRGALRFALLCLGVAIVGTVRRYLTPHPVGGSRSSA